MARSSAATMIYGFHVDARIYTIFVFILFFPSLSCSFFYNLLRAL